MFETGSKFYDRIDEFTKSFSQLVNDPKCDMLLSEIINQPVILWFIVKYEVDDD